VSDGCLQNSSLIKNLRQSKPLRLISLLCLDLGGVFLAYGLAFWLHFDSFFTWPEFWENYHPLFLKSLPFLMGLRVVANWCWSLYHWSFSQAGAMEAGRLFFSALSGSAAFILFNLFLNPSDFIPPRSIYALEFFLSLSFMTLPRFAPIFLYDLYCGFHNTGRTSWQSGCTGVKLLYPFLKRLTDLCLAFSAVVLLSPFILAVTLWIKLDSPGPVLFRQRRFAQGRRHFNILKFRTMRQDTPTDVPTHLLADPWAYITRSGAFLRRTSLDELPQLLNIIKGDMSLVGPRPVILTEDDLIAERERLGANDVPVGLTGWAQINGRDELTGPVKAALDGEYVRRRSFFFDLQIMALTGLWVLQARGVVEGGPNKLP